MLRHHLKTALRSLVRYKGYTALNLVGLAAGIASTVLIMLFVRDELSYDRFHSDADRIYRVLDIRMQDGVGERSTSAPSVLAETLLLEYPDEIETAVRFFNFQAPHLSLAHIPASGEPRAFNESRFFFTDPEIFTAFDFELVQGDPVTALKEPKSLVLTEEAAARYFGDENPIGKRLRFEDEHDFTVTGVLAPVPDNAHFRFDLLASFSSLDDPSLLEPLRRNTWIWNPTWTYVLLKNHVEPAWLEARFPAFVQKYYPESRRDRVTLQLQPLTDIHLRSHLAYEIEPNSRIEYVYVFSAVAVLILLIAVINFVNLTTARSAQRASEIGIRKVVGARRRNLIIQFLGESVMTSMMATALSIPVILALLPLLNEVSGKALTFDLTGDAGIAAGSLGIGLLVGVLAGLYPAFYLSLFRPARVLKGTFRAGRRAVGFRKALVVSQFAISVVLIVGTLAADEQLQLLRSAELGFDEEHVVILPVFRSDVVSQYEAFKDRLVEEPVVRSAALVEEVIGKKNNTGSFEPEGLSESRQFERLMVWPGAVETLGLELAAGRAFSDERNGDRSEILINEAAVHYLGWNSPEEAVGKRFTTDPDESFVVGVVKDFHHASLHREIGPFVIMKPPDTDRTRTFFGRYVAVRLNPGSATRALAAVESVWTAFAPGQAFDYSFLDDELDALYRSEQNLGTVMTGFAVLAILVACLGLFGLASYMAERRTKEIGIRKVLGASVQSLVRLLSFDFLKLVGCALVVGLPLSYVIVTWWLNDFAYRVDVGFGILLFAAATALATAMLTVTYQAVRAASADPVKNLRYE